jgi:hypothetical protein
VAFLEKRCLDQRGLVGHGVVMCVDHRRQLGADRCPTARVWCRSTSCSHWDQYVPLWDQCGA